MKKIVTIGGGSGMPVINEALLFAGIKKITSIVTVMDSGGITGRMRTDSRGQEIAYSDGLRTLLSLVNPKLKSKTKFKTLWELLRKRNDKGEDLGYIIFSHFFDEELGFSRIQEILERLTDTKFCGQVLPVTTQSSQLIFSTKSGQVFKGEHELDDKRMSSDMVEKIWIEPETMGFKKAVEAIMEADLIIFSCGSLYGSVLANLLPKGINQALKISKSVKVLVTNLASTRNETHSFTPADYIKVFDKYSQSRGLLDLLIIPQMSQKKFEKKYPETAARYALDYSYFLGWEDKDAKEAEKLGISFLRHNAVTVDPVLKRIRHDPKKLSLVLKKLL